MGDFIRPEPTRIDLSGGRFIVVKKRLNVGEREDMLAAMSTNGAGPATLNRREVRIRTVLTYLLAWSLTDGDEHGEGLPVPIGPELSDADRVSTIRNLDPDIFDEITQAIDQHSARAEAQKKMTPGGTASSATSPSPSELVGATSG